MLDQSFSPKSLLRLVRKEDVAHYRMWSVGEDRDAVMRGISESINDPEFSFPTLQEKTMRGKTVYSAPDATTMLALRKLDRNMRAIYKVKQANRDNMVHQVKSLMREGCAFTVLRFDIRSFYESVNRTTVLERIARDSILSHTSRTLLRKLFESPQLAGQPGVPRGLGVSATLSELYARSLDRHLQSLRHVYFYGRYVDDMIVFTHTSAEKAEADVLEALDTIGLELNPKPEKRSVVACFGDKRTRDHTAEGFEFLGYQLACRLHLADQKAWRDVTVRIAPSKVRKIKSRIAHALVAYAAAPDFPLLLRRIRFLAGNYVLRGTENGGLCGGIYYNYHHITDTTDLDEIDTFLRRMVFARKGSIGVRLRSSLSDAQRRELVKICFKRAFEFRFSRRLPWGEMAELQRCWAYEKN